MLTFSHHGAAGEASPAADWNGGFDRGDGDGQVHF